MLVAHGLEESINCLIERVGGKFLDVVFSLGSALVVVGEEHLNDCAELVIHLLNLIYWRDFSQ